MMSIREHLEQEANEPRLTSNDLARILRDHRPIQVDRNSYSFHGRENDHLDSIVEHDEHRDA